MDLSQQQKRIIIELIKDKFHIWNLMYRNEIIIFIIGFIIGALIF